MLKKHGIRHPEQTAVVHHRNFWGRSEEKREALRASLEMGAWSAKKKASAALTPEGPRAFEEFEPDQQSRWKLVPFSAQGGFDDWPALDQLFVSRLQGVNPNRGREGSVVEMNPEDLASRMRDYFSDLPHETMLLKHPVLMKDRARYEAKKTRDRLRAKASFDETKIVPYVVFPLDVRWLYYETACKLLNEARPDLFEILDQGEFLVTVPEPRKESETRPILLTGAFDLHLHDRGSVAFPMEVNRKGDAGPLFEEGVGAASRVSNISPSIWAVLKERWGLRGELQDRHAKALARSLARFCLAVCHSPAYQAEHKEPLSQDWAHLPIPRQRASLERAAETGGIVALLLNPSITPTKQLRAVLGDAAKHLAVPSKVGGGMVGQKDLTVEYSFLGAAAGGWRARAPLGDEPMREQWGRVTGDLFLNDSVCLRHVPEKVWRYELGGYPVIKKWLGYRDKGRRPRVPLSMREVSHLRSIVQRISAILCLHPALDEIYEQCCLDCFSAEELGI